MSGIWTAALMATFFGADRPPLGEVVPLPHQQVSLLLDGAEITRWHFGDDTPRPFLYPFNGPSGRSLTRMGHPGAANYEHHRSVWFGHANVEGESFWKDGAGTTISQKRWIAYEDLDQEAVMAVLLEWVSSKGEVLLEQTVIVGVIPAENGHAMEIQTTLEVPKGREKTRLEKKDDGLLAVRVAKSISAAFGGGVITDSLGRVGESAVTGQESRWVDVSGQIASSVGSRNRYMAEGLTYFDHPSNPMYPSKWKVRADGSIIASICADRAINISKYDPLTLRYLLYAHRDDYLGSRAERVHREFAGRPAYVVRNAKSPTIQFKVRRDEE